MYNIEKWTALAVSLGQLQHDLASIQRWGKFNVGDQGLLIGKLEDCRVKRLQSVCHHAVEIGEICEVVIHLLASHLALAGLQLDWSLLRQAVRVHDFGEAVHVEAGNDISMPLKTDDDDRQEYEHFVQFLDKAYLDCEEFKAQMRRAFLLQFCLHGNGSLPQDIMTDLKANHRTEALMFEAIERWGYLIYALEQYTRFQNVDIVRDVLIRNAPHYKRLSQDLPGFKEVLWTDNMKRWSGVFLREHGTELTY